MNRKERRRLSKKLGITQHQRNLPFERRMEIIRENIIAGKNAHLGRKEQVRVQKNKQIEEMESQVVNNIINDIINKKKDTPIADIVEEAKSEYEKRSTDKQ